MYIIELISINFILWYVLYNAYLWAVVFAALDIIEAYGIKLIEKTE